MANAVRVRCERAGGASPDGMARGNAPARAMETESEHLRSRVYRLLEGSWHESAWGKAVNAFLICLIAVNVLAVILESVDSLGRAYGDLFTWFEIFSVAVFTVEYAIRLWICTDDPRSRFAHPVFGRLRYALTPMAIIDFLAIFPFYLTFFVTLDLRFLRVFRLLRLLKLTRYSPAAELLWAVLYNERRALLSASLFMIVLLVFASSMMHIIENEAQPEAFGSIPAAMWWGMATLTTVGYGDVTPVTPLGRLLGGLVTVLGVGMFALPAGILASGFAQEVKKRDFIISWNVVAKVPLFSQLAATEIGEIAGLLRLRVAVPGEAIVRKDEQADSVYFVSSGRLNVELEPEPVELGRGDFFGELALLQEGKRTATVRAVTSCQLLVLDCHDFHHLMEENRLMREAVDRVAAERLEQLNAPGAAPLEKADSAA